MGTTVSSLQILGTTEDAVKAAMPNAVVGRWSERFITACPVELCFGKLDRKAGWAFREAGLYCAFRVHVRQRRPVAGTLCLRKAAVRHVVYTQAEGRVLGNANVLCEGLGLSSQIAPLLNGSLRSLIRRKSCGFSPACWGRRCLSAGMMTLRRWNSSWRMRDRSTPG